MKGAGSERLSEGRANWLKDSFLQNQMAQGKLQGLLQNILSKTTNDESARHKREVSLMHKRYRKKLQKVRNEKRVIFAR